MLVMMYIRFESFRKMETSAARLGIFQVAIQLRDSGKLNSYEQDILEDNLKWLNTHLKSPECLREEHNFRAICWFHFRAARPIEKVRTIMEILKEYGVQIEMVKTKDPGVIIYKDGWQVVAKPRKRSRWVKSRSRFVE